MNCEFVVWSQCYLLIMGRTKSSVNKYYDYCGPSDKSTCKECSKELQVSNFYITLY